MKALFLDFYGTAVDETGPVIYEVIKRVYKSGKASSPEEVARRWWKTYPRKVCDAYGDGYRRQYDVALECFKELLDFFKSTEDAAALTERMVDHWSKPPSYEDTRWFMDQIPVPIYFVTNSDNRFVEAAVKNLGLEPSGIITNEQARHSKPRPEIFQYALDKIGLRAADVIHIGDSLNGDVYCPQSIGIQAIWMNRKEEPVPEGVRAVKNWQEALAALV